MTKNMFKRTWLSVIRKPSKSVVLILLMFVMANLVLASLLIKNAVNENITAIKESLGSEIYLTTDTESLMEEMMSSMDTTASQKNRPNMNEYRPDITLDMAVSIGNSEYVRDLTYSTTSSANAVDFTVVETSTDDKMNFDKNIQSNNNSGDILINSINAYAFITGVDNGTMEIVEGTYFDETTDNMVMISYELAEENSLVVGDKITLENTETEETNTVEIIGIFLNSTSGFENTIYMNLETASSFFTSNNLTDDGDYTVSNVVYYLTNPDYLDSFIEQANTLYPDLEEQYLSLDINNQAYEQMAGSIEQVGEFADTILIVVISASILIITLLVNNNVKDRKYEIGVLSALGARKSNIAGQILSELILTASIGFILSFGTSYFVAENLSVSLLENQSVSESVTNEQSFGRPGMGTNMKNTTSNTPILDVDTVDKINITPSIESYLLLFVIGYAVAFVAMIIPTINIVKYEPKTILTGRE